MPARRNEVLAATWRRLVAEAEAVGHPGADGLGGDVERTAAHAAVGAQLLVHVAHDVARSGEAQFQCPVIVGRGSTNDRSNCIASLNGVSGGGWTSYAKKIEEAGADGVAAASSPNGTNLRHIVESDTRVPPVDRGAWR